MFTLFGLSISYYDIFLCLLLLMAWAYVSSESKKTQQEKTVFNQEVAKNLGWNVFFNTPPKLLYNYIFLRDYGTKMWFEGNAGNAHMKLVPFYLGNTGRGVVILSMSYFLAAEFSSFKNKSYGFAIVSWLANISAYKKFQRISVADEEFNKNFIIYNLQPENTYKGLSPTTIQTLLNYKELFFDKSLAIEVRENATFIAGNYKPYGNYMVTQSNDVQAKKQILNNFLENTSEILKMFKN